MKALAQVRDLGDASTLDKVCCVRDGRADCLAVKREGTDAKGG